MPEQHLKLAITGMTCAGCQAFVEKTLRAQTGVQQANVNLLLRQAAVMFDPARTNPAALISAVNATGYQAQVAKDLASAVSEQQQLQHDAQRETRRTAWRAGVGGVAAGVAMALSMAWGEEAPVRFGLLVLTVVMMLHIGGMYYRKAWHALRRGMQDMNTLVATGTLAAFAFSAASTLMPETLRNHGVQPVIYFETVLTILALLQVGQWLESRAMGQTLSALRGLADLQPPRAWLVRGDTECEVDVSTLVPGDVVRIKPGARVPVDGQIQDGNSSIDASWLTGEAMPMTVGPGDGLQAGTLNQQGSLRMVASRGEAHSAVARVVGLLRAAQGSRAPVAHLADRLAAWFAPLVTVLACITYGVWHVLLHADVGWALAAGVAVLVIACPCAMGLAVPTALMVATGRGARLGVLFKGGEALQRLAAINACVFDKTGTLTQGKPQVQQVHVWHGDKDDVVRLAASMERASEHPLAQAVLQHASALPLSQVSQFEAVAGAGVRGMVADQPTFVGKQSWLESLGVATQAGQQAAASMAAQGWTVVWVAQNQTALGILGIGDAPRPEAAVAVQTLRQRGVQVGMLSGDHAATVATLGAQLGIAPEHQGAETTPADKVTFVQKLQGHGLRVAMVGDGINDAAALAQAHVGVAMGSGAEVAMRAADVTLMRPNLHTLVQAHMLARQTLRVVRQNLFWAFIFNAVAIPVAAGVLYPWTQWMLSPMVASAAMASSSIAVVSNSLRLWRMRVD